VSVRIFKVDAAAAVVPVNFIRSSVMGVSPESEATLPNAIENFVKRVFTYEKGVVRPNKFTTRIDEVERDVILKLHREEEPKRRRLCQPEDFGQKVGGNFLVP
jgi:hypothetical protein